MIREALVLFLGEITRKTVFIKLTKRATAMTPEFFPKTGTSLPHVGNTATDGIFFA